MGDKLKLNIINNKINEYKYLLRGFSRLFVDLKAIELFYDVSEYHEYKTYCQYIYSAYKEVENLCNANIQETNVSHGKINSKLENNIIKETKNVMYNESLFIGIIRTTLKMDELEFTYLPNYRNEKLYVPITISPFQECLESKLNVEEKFKFNDNLFEQVNFYKRSRHIKALIKLLQTEKELKTMEEIDGTKTLEKTVENCKEKNKKLFFNLLDYQVLKSTINKQFKNISNTCSVTEKMLEESKVSKRKAAEVLKKFQRINYVRNKKVDELYQQEHDFCVNKSLNFKSPTEWSIPLELKK